MLYTLGRMPVAPALQELPVIQSTKGPMNWLHKKNNVEENLMRIVPHLLGAAIAAALISTPVFAAELTGTLKKIKESGTITLGHRDASIPFSYIADATGKPMGYSHDIQMKIVEAIKKDLDMPNLQVKYNLVTSQTRIPLVQNGTVDVECGSTTNNVERQQQVDFSVQGLRRPQGQERRDHRGHHVRAHPQVDECRQADGHERHLRQRPRRVLPDAGIGSCRCVHDG
jgi:glutamate/aspartate transport system substrate-binding protein